VACGRIGEGSGSRAIRADPGHRPGSPIGHHPHLVLDPGEGEAPDEESLELQEKPGLGDTYEAAGEQEAARATLAHALDLLEQLNHPDADQLRTRLKASG
jgi:hypothetical protein